MSKPIPGSGEPLTNPQIVEVLTSFMASPEFTMVVTVGPARRGLGVIKVQQVPPGKELHAMETSAAVLPKRHQVHALYAGDLITMNGGTNGS